MSIKFNKKILYPFPFKWLLPGKNIKFRENPDDKNVFIDAIGGGEGGGTTIVTDKNDPVSQLEDGDYWFEIVE